MERPTTESTEVANDCIQVFHESKARRMLAALDPALEDQGCDGNVNCNFNTKHL